MLGSAVFRTGTAPGGALAGPWTRNSLWTAARAVPSLDLRFAENKSLVDATTGQNLVTFTRASSGTYVDSQGVIRTATTNLLLRSEEFDNASWSGGAGGNATVTPNAIQSPVGTLTADLLDDTSAAAVLGKSQSLAITSSTRSYTASCYIKANSSSIASIRLSVGTGGTTVAGEVVVDLSTGAAQWRAGAVGTSFSVVNAGGNWYRVAVVVTDNASGNTLCIAEFRPAFATTYSDTLNSAAQGSAYFWGAQLEQSSTVGEYIPTTSTINSAPRFDHNPTTGESLGLLVEESRTNSLLQSENFSATWTLNAVTVGSSITAPNGTTTAQKLEETATTTEHRATQASSSGATTTAVTLSVFAKAAERTKIRLAFTTLASWTGGGGAAVIFDLLTGTATPDSSTPTAFSITPFANGWYRCSITGTPTSSLTPSGNIFLYTTANSYAGTLGEGAYLWGAQLEVGAFPTSYIPTTTATATRSADVASITGSNFGTSRTNLQTWSEDFRNTADAGATRPWTYNTSAVTADNATAPNGATTADLVAGAAGTANKFLSNNVPTTATGSYTFSVFLKQGTEQFVVIRLTDGSANGIRGRFDLSTGVVVVTNEGTATGQAANATAVGNGWYRCVVTCSVSSLPSSVMQPQLWLNNFASTSLTTNYYAWGAQLEVGSTATNYIPTTTAAVTVVDSPWYRQDEGTVFADGSSANLTASTFPVFADFSVDTSNRLRLSYITTTQGGAIVNSGGITTAQGYPSVTLNPRKGAFSWSSSGSYSVVFNSGAATTFAGTYPVGTFSQLTIGNSTLQNTSNNLNGTIRRLTYWPIRLGNNFLQAITQ